MFFTSLCAYRAPMVARAVQKMLKFYQKTANFFQEPCRVHSSAVRTSCGTILCAFESWDRATKHPNNSGARLATTEHPFSTFVSRSGDMRAESHPHRFARWKINVQWGTQNLRILPSSCQCSNRASSWCASWPRWSTWSRRVREPLHPACILYNFSPENAIPKTSATSSKVPRRLPLSKIRVAHGRPNFCFRSWLEISHFLRLF